MENFLIVSGQVWILFALIGVGALARRLKMVDDAASRGFVNVLVHIVTPCLIIDVFQRPFAPDMMRQLLLAFVISVSAHIAGIVMARICVRTKDAATAPVLHLAAVFSNAGFMGIPLEQAIFGEKGVFFGIVYVATFNLFMWSWGLRTMRGGGGVEIRQMLLNPGTVGLAIGLPLFLFSVDLPEAVAAPVSMLSALNTPLAMLLIGYYLAGADFAATLRMPAAMCVAAVRLVIYPLALVAALYPLRSLLDREMMLSIVTAASAPVAAMTAMFAAKYERDVGLGVGLVSGTTLASVVTMPVVIAIAFALLGA